MQTETLEQKQSAVIDLVSSELRPILTPEFFVDRSRQEADRLRAEKLNAEARLKATLWRFCKTCYSRNKARIVGVRKVCPHCNSPMRPLVSEFGEEGAIEEAREESKYRRQLRNEATEHRRMLSSVADTPTITVSEGNHKDTSKERGR